MECIMKLNLYIGLDDMTIKNLLGQKTIQVTRRYIHPQFETLAERLKIVP